MVATTPAHDVSPGKTTFRLRKRPGMPPLDKAIPLARLGRATSTGHYWSVPYPDAVTLVSWAREQGLAIDPVVQDYAENLWTRELSAMTTSSAAQLPESEPPIEVTGLTATPLLPQQVAISAASRCWMQRPGQDGQRTHRALLIADEPGLGKTLMSLAALRIRHQEVRKAVIVCPTSLTANWHDEISQRFAPGTFTPWTATTKTATPPPPGVDTVIIGWEILADWADVLLAWAPDGLVVDEGHYAKSGKQRTRKTEALLRDNDGNVVRDGNGKVQMVESRKVVGGSARATAALELGASVEKQHGLILALTGTPIVNRPLELAPLLDLIGVLNLWGGMTPFKHRHCGPKRVKIGNGQTALNFQGASNLLELNTRLRTSGHYLRRTKQVLIDAGVMQRKYVDKVFTFDYQTTPRPWVIRATAGEMRPYLDCERSQSEFFRERADEIAATMKGRVTSARVREKLESEGAGAKHLKRIIELRQEAARVKVPYVIRTAQDLVMRGEKVVIAAYHRDIVDQYAAAFTGLKIQGEMGVKAIEEAKRHFNETPVTEHPVLVLSVEAGKTGHTLCKQTIHGVGPACAHMIFAEQIWTPGDESQAQDRIWRIGQDREVRISNAVLADSFDEQMFWQRVKKKKIVNAAIDAVGDPAERDDSDDEKKGRGQLVGILAFDIHARPERAAAS